MDVRHNVELYIPGLDEKITFSYNPTSRMLALNGDDVFEVPYGSKIEGAVLSSKSMYDDDTRVCFTLYNHTCTDFKKIRYPLWISGIGISRDDAKMFRNAVEYWFSKL